MFPGQFDAPLTQTRVIRRLDAQNVYLNADANLETKSSGAGEFNFYFGKH